MTESEKDDIQAAETADLGENGDPGTSLLSKMQAVFENLPFNSWVKDNNGRYVAVNKTFCDAIGLPDEGVIGKTDDVIFLPEQAMQSRDREKACMSAGKRLKFEDKDKDGRWFEIHLSPIIDRNGKVSGIAGFSRDITDIKASESALIDSEARLKRAQTIARMGNWEMEKGSSQLWASEEFFRIFGFDKQDSCILSIEKVRKAISDDDIIKRDIAFKRLMESNLDYDVEYRIRRSSDGIERFIHSSAVMEKDSQGRPHKVLGIIQDITDRKKNEEQIRYLNDHDLLTGAYNRGSFERALRKLDTGQEVPLSVIMIDVNGLKLTNDMFGHSEGDKLLIRVSNILKDCCPKDGLVARIGGDEFCLLLPRTASETARDISAQIINICEIANGSKCLDLICPSVSLGYATKKEPGDSICKVMNEAESFMHKRKLMERKSLRSSVLSSIKASLFEKSHETEEHAERLVELSNLVGIQLGLTDAHLHDLSLLASLHDIGKLSVDEYILCKPGKLTDEEWAEIRKHPEVGYRIAKSSPELMSIADYILCHHERWDGKGYPQGLKSRNIPLLSRILAVVDAYDAMTQDRSYRKAAPVDNAINEIIKHSGTQFDPDVAIVFIQTMKDRLS